MESEFASCRGSRGITLDRCESIFDDWCDFDEAKSTLVNEGNNQALKPTRVILLAVIIAIAVWLGLRLFASSGSILSQAQKIAAVMSLIESAYVKPPDTGRLTEGAIEGMLKRLDPHSVYIPSSEQKEISERDLGEFQGIGVSFVIQNELITVVSPIVGSPSDRLGIRSGDRIIEIDSVTAYGISEDEVFKRLRGKKGSTVHIKVLREGLGEPIDFTIVRDDIPIYSVFTSFMIDDSTGYLLLNQFTATTSSELQQALRKLENAGMKRLLFDLRNNGGGRLNEAVVTADMFLPAGYTIVSRKGRTKDDDEIYRSTDPGTHPMWELIVLVNGGSASASEIIAAAVQDLDRGLVVGQQTFGKGLVQNTYPLNDGSVIRLSTAHWYAPSGRLVQIPYDKGREDYYAITYQDQSSTAAEKDRVPFKTLSGRTVYGTVGVMPDSTVEDNRITLATAQIIGSQLVFALSSKLARESKYKSNDDFEDFRQNYSITDADLQRLIPMAKEKGREYSADTIGKDAAYLKSLLKAEIAQLIWNDRDKYYKVLISEDSVVKTAIKLFPLAQMTASHWRRG